MFGNFFSAVIIIHNILYYNTGEKMQWTIEAKKILCDRFAKKVNGLGLPGKKDSTQVIDNFPQEFENRTLKSINDCVRNMQGKKRRCQETI